MGRARDPATGRKRGGECHAADLFGSGFEQALGGSLEGGSGRQDIVNEPDPASGLQVCGHMKCAADILAPRHTAKAGLRLRRT